ncbi:ATP-binding protein [Microvirga sp. W0021]|uniref:histidine kinase n=1 Tax=Hohaiivirga grylli TaxID=3133970 RepID=A0ABV0BFS2_9HYPH
MKKAGSIRWRLYIAAIITIVLALAVAGAGLAFLFERHITRRVDADMYLYLQRTSAHIDISTETGEVSIQTPSGRENRQRALKPFGGYYWQITDNDEVVQTSRSLWDQTIAMPPHAPANPQEIQRYNAPGPNGTQLRVTYRQLLIDRPTGDPHRIGVFVAVDYATISTPRQEFMRDILPFLALLAVVLIVSTFVYLNYGLRPLESIRREMTAIRSGKKERFPENVPTELQPLSEEINALLDVQDKELERAKNRAADLAHGLKTPLTAMAGDVRRLREKGEEEIASEISQAIGIMNNHVAREMTRARVRSIGSKRYAKIPVAKTLLPLVGTLQRTPSGAALDWQFKILPGISIAMDREDLMEIMGNLLENASRYAKSKIILDAKENADGLILTIDDDGPGLSDKQCEQVHGRGQRLDESGGAGLGLAIVQDVANAYNAKLTLSQSDLGGLQASIFMPAKFTGLPEA